MTRNYIKLAIAGLVAIALVSFSACSKYKGFKKDKSGIYYQFHGDRHDTAYMPQTGDLVAVMMSMRAGDSLLVPMVPQQMIMDTLYKGDLFDAFRLMHLGDSATFILDGKEFFEKMLQTPQEYPFGETPLYFDVKLFDVMKKADYEVAKAEYDAEMDSRKVGEKETIEEYLSENKGFSPTESGVFMKKLKNGNGANVEPLQKVKVHYTGRLTDGTKFDSSVERGTPFEFTVGTGEVIPGWDAVVSQMRVGDKVTVLIPSELAYGAQGNYAIPPYSPLVFDIELLSVEN